MIIYELTGNIPSKKNSKIATRHGVFSSKKYVEWHKDATIQILDQAIATVDNYPVAILIELTRSDNRLSDIDNAVGSIMDLLTDTGVILDDSYKYVDKIEVRWCGKSNLGGAKITILDKK